MPEKYVFPILMLVIWPVHFFYVRSAIFSILRAAMSKTMTQKQRKAHPGFWNWLTYRGVASAIRFRSEFGTIVNCSNIRLRRLRFMC